MESQVNHWISASEGMWLEHLELQCCKAFIDTFLPSHDQEHHNRVWKNCKTLLREISGINKTISEDFVEGLLLAAWFHDAGMSIDKGPRHGELGSQMFESFLQKGQFNSPTLKKEIKEAIEKHDIKEAWIYAPVRTDSSPGILSLLSIADDMDAFGINGIYRYAEIYLHRGISTMEIGNRILENAEIRYQNIISSCNSLPNIKASVSEGFETLKKFYSLYNQEITEVKNADIVKQNHIGIINHIRKYSVESRVRPENLRNKLEKSGSGNIKDRFFKKLKDELEKAHN